MHYITETKVKMTPEKFYISNAVPTLMTVEMHPIETIVVNNLPAEKFYISNPTISRMTVDNITIVSTIPI